MKKKNALSIRTTFGASTAALALSLTLISAAHAQPQLQPIPEFILQDVITDIQMPWGMVWLPNGDMLVTERTGNLYRVSNGQTGEPIAGLPEIHVNGQGGLLDIVLHPDYERNGWLYISFSDPSGQGEGSNTTIIRAKLDGNRLTSQEAIYTADINSTRGQHYGGRLVFDNDGYLFFSIGDRGDHFTNVQDLGRDGGKIYRLHDDGRVPSDNPFVDNASAKSAVWSYGHRNPQGIGIHPLTGEVWASEHGPRGGDEINIARAGLNYGWPVIGYGINYNGEPLAQNTKADGMEQPIWYWNPSIAVAGMTFVTSDRYPELNNDLLVGGLAGSKLVWLELHDDRVIRSTDLLTDIGRVRAVSQGPDGYIYLGIEGSGIQRLVPAGN